MIVIMIIISIVIVIIIIVVSVDTHFGLSGARSGDLATIVRFAGSATQLL